MGYTVFMSRPSRFKVKKVPRSSRLDKKLEDDSVMVLQDFLKISVMVETGGEAKFRIQGGEVKLNGEIETRRRKKLYQGDVVEYLGERLVVSNDASNKY